MNGTYIFVLSIIAIVMVAGVFRTYLQERKRPPEVDEEMEDTLAKIERLEERIQVLERIITEKRFDLKSEIDSL